MKIAMAASHVIGYADGDHVIYADAEVVFEGAKVIGVFPAGSATVDRRSDYGKSVIGPGLIDLDALADVDHAILDTWQAPTDRLGLLWSQDYVAAGPAEVLTAAQRAKRRVYALCQLIRHGVTTAMPIASEHHGSWAETEDDLEAMTAAAQQLGLRMYLGPSFRSGVTTVTSSGTRQVTWDGPAGERGLAAAVGFAERVDRDRSGLLRGCLLPCRVENLTKELMVATAETAAHGGWLVRLHCLQSRAELEMLHALYGQDPLSVLDEVGLLGPSLLVPHGAFIGGLEPDERTRKRDLDRLAASQSTVVHCPWTLGRYGVALASFDDYLEAGVRMAFGSDSFPPDLLRGMEYGSVVAKLTSGRVDAGSHADIYRAATLGGATALGRPDLGRLAPGCAADIIVVDLSGFESGPIDDPVRTMIMHATGRDVRTVVIAGQTVVDDWSIPGVDLAALGLEAQRILVALKAGYPARDYLRRELDELFPPSFVTRRPPTPEEVDSPCPSFTT